MMTIVGNGAIGNLLALRCYQNDLQYQAIIRGVAPSQIHVSGLFGTQSFPLPLLNSSLPIEEGFLILPLKAHQIVACVEELKARLSPNVCVVLLHNGMGPQHQVRHCLPDNPIIVATTSYGALKKTMSQLKVTGIGDSQAGWLSSPGDSKQVSAIKKLLPPCSWQQNIEEILWKKLAVNAVINPLTAINNVKNGRLLDSAFQQQIKQICDETALVMTYLGFKLDGETLVERCNQVAQATADNYSSMHQDIFLGRPSEIDYINGYVVSQAQNMSLDVPMHLALYQQIKKMEA